MVNHASQNSMTLEELKSHFPIGTQIRYEFMGHEGVVVGHQDISLIYQITKLIKTPNTARTLEEYPVGEQVSAAFHYRIEVIKPKLDYSAITAGVVEGS